MNASSLVVGADVGGTKVDVALVDSQGSVVDSSRRPAGVQATPDWLVADIAGWVQQAAALGRRIAALGLGVAGQVDQATGTVRFSPNLPGWVNVPIRAQLAHALGIPVFAINDVQAATWGEWRLGAGVGNADMVCIFVGTGVGGGVVSGGHMLSGANGTAGELGHTVLDYRGPPCRCGSSGCLEAYVGGWGIALRAQQAVKGEPEKGRPMLDMA